MKGLFIYTYDYYEWEDLIAVSESADRLKERHLEEKKQDYKLATNEDEHNELAHMETYHYMIKDVELV